MSNGWSGDVSDGRTVGQLTPREADTRCGVVGSLCTEEAECRRGRGEVSLEGEVARLLLVTTARIFCLMAAAHSRASMSSSSLSCCLSAVGESAAKRRRHIVFSEWNMCCSASQLCALTVSLVTCSSRAHTSSIASSGSSSISCAFTSSCLSASLSRCCRCSSVRRLHRSERSRARAVQYSSMKRRCGREG